MKQFIKSNLRKISTFFQGSTESFIRHDSQYREINKLEKERKAGLHNIQTDLINGPEMRVRDLLNDNPQIKVAVDVGSGSGWSVAAMSKLVEKVIGIEPSLAGIELSKTIYPSTDYSNITWVNGLAEEVLPELKLETPTLFLTGCVLSHIRDREVIKICEAIDNAAPSGSVISLAECFADKEWHQLMWHIRTKDWWKKRFPRWELNFHGPEVPDKDGYKGKYYKGIWGVKK